MSADIEPVAEQEQTTRKRRAGAYVRVGIAGAAIIGIGAGLTVAAWTDQVGFQLGAQAANSFDLQGRVGTTGEWSDAAEIPLGEVTDLAPGEGNRSYTIEIQNIGSAPAKITPKVTAKLGGEDIGYAVTVADVPATLAAAASASMKVTVSPDQLPITLQGKSGTITLSFTGSVPTP